MAKIIMIYPDHKKYDRHVHTFRKRSLNIKGDHRLIVTQFVCQDIFLFFIFLSFFTKQIFLLTTIFLCKKWVKIVDNVDNYSHLSLIFDISTNMNSFVCAICTIYPLSIIFFENKLSFLSTNCLTIHYSYPH